MQIPRSRIRVQASVVLLFAAFSIVPLPGARAQESFGMRLSEAAMALTRQQVRYDPAYYAMPYPGGDLPTGRGVCTDVVIRAYRALGIDLQKEVHEDMRAHFELYPPLWGLSRPDRNIDHRRVPNLMVFFTRHGMEKPRSRRPADYLPGDIVCWRLPQGATHIGIAVSRRSADGQRPLIVHNIGAGQVLADCLFEFEIIGHYSFKK
jgi:uncharacterized protein